jgi:hypothetical protein
MLAAAYWMARAEWAPLAANERHIRLLEGTFLYLTLAWLGSFGVTLWTYMAISLDDAGELVRTAMETALHGLWFVPAMLLVSPPAERVAAAIGIAVMANAARLIVSNPPPRLRRLSRQKSMTPNIFGDTDIQRSVFTRESVPAIVGAFSLQSGLFALWAGYQQWAAVLIAGSAACWTWVSITRGAHAGEKRIHVLHRVLSVSAAVLFSMALSAVRADIAPGAEAFQTAESGWLEASREELRNRINPAQPKPAADAVAFGRRAPVRIDTANPEPNQLGKGGIPGLILQPGRKKKAPSLALARALRPGATLNLRTRLSIPFTGEYHLFRQSSARLPPGAIQRAGSPMDDVYKTTNGTAMETDAYQEFDPPVDFAPCARIQMTLTSGEIFPASATLILIGAESVGQLGPEIFAMSSAPEETLEFAVPAAAAGRAVKGIRVIFVNSPMEASHSTRVEIQRFTFVPSGL